MQSAESKGANILVRRVQIFGAPFASLVEKLRSGLGVRVTRGQAPVQVTCVLAVAGFFLNVKVAGCSELKYMNESMH
jgi:hypothetical protein